MPTETTGGGNAGPDDSLIWRNAIRKYYEELEKGGIKGPAIQKDLWSVETVVDLLGQIKILVPPDTKIAETRRGLIGRLEPVLSSLSDFAALTACAFGMNGKVAVAAVVWGSIRLLLKLAKPMLPEVLDMLEHLQQTLPRYSKYEKELPMTDALESLLSNMYTEIIVFCARAIIFFRNNPTIGTKQNIWSQFHSEFSKTMDNLRSYSRRIDEEVDMIRLTRETNSAEAIKVIQGLRDAQSADDACLPCYMVPHGLNPRFCNREADVAKLREVLDPQAGKDKLRVMAVHGLGGVGKTQLALHYTNTSLQLYDIVAWIPSETQIKLTQAISELALKLGLSNADMNADNLQAVVRIRDWLNKSGRRFLLIFDNVDTIDIPLQVWPASDKGSILMTTRSPSVASKRATDVMNLQPFGPEAGIEALYSLTCMKATTDEDTAAAEEIHRLLGGLPLAIIQMSDFIRQRGYSYKEFLNLYRSSAAKIHERLKKETPVEYNKTIGTVWELQIQRLSDDASTLQKIMAFFDPGRIAERLLINPKSALTDDRLTFLTDELDFGDTVGELLGASLIDRSAIQKSFSIHRLVQNTVFSRLSRDETTYFLDTAITLLYHGFPNTWRGTGDQQGHGWALWEICSEVLPHVGWLMKLVKRHSLNPSHLELFAELIFQSGTYLWEREQPTAAGSFFKFGLSLGIDRGGPIYTSANRLLGHIALDLAQPRAALEAYNETLAATLKIRKSDDPAIADIYDSIACSYTEIGAVDKAHTYLDMAFRIHYAEDPSRMARTHAILAMTYLRAGRPTEALTALNECWRLQNLTQNEIAASKYPKHSGDIVLLSRIQHALGHKKPALELASASITIRKGILGHKGPRVADSMHLVAGMLREEGKELLAAKLLREIIEMGQGMEEMGGQSARALWSLGCLEDQLGNHAEAEVLKGRARLVRQGIAGREGQDEDSDGGFSRLVGYMLW